MIDITAMPNLPDPVVNKLEVVGEKIDVMTNLLHTLKADKEFETWALGKSWQEIFYHCPKGEWLLWLFQRTNPEDIQLLTLAKGHCANTLRCFMKNYNDRSAIDAAINFGNGLMTLTELTCLTSEALKRVLYYNSEFAEIERKFDLDLDSEGYRNSNLSEVLIDSKNSEQLSNFINSSISEIAYNAVNIFSSADLIANETAKYLQLIVDEYGPFGVPDYKTSNEIEKIIEFASFDLLYAYYIERSENTCFGDTAEIAKIKNQINTANICRKLLPFNIWKINTTSKD